MTTEKRTELYTSEDCIPDSLAMDWNDRVLVLEPASLIPECRTPDNQLWRGDGGFGCHPGKNGTAVYAVCLADDERARWRRSDFIGVLKPEHIPDNFESSRPAVAPPKMRLARERDYKEGMRDEHY